MDTQNNKPKSLGWGIASLFLTLTSLVLFSLYGVRTSSLIVTAARGGHADRDLLRQVTDWKSTSVAFAIVGMVLSVIAMRQSPGWIGRLSFLLGILACCTIPILV
jgi:hypothetical protein